MSSFTLEQDIFYKIWLQAHRPFVRCVAKDSRLMVCVGAMSSKYPVSTGEWMYSEQTPWCNLWLKLFEWKTSYQVVLIPQWNKNSAFPVTCYLCGTVIIYLFDIIFCFVGVKNNSIQELYCAYVCNAISLISVSTVSLCDAGRRLLWYIKCFKLNQK